jgi:hypothetical protein
MAILGLEVPSRLSVKSFKNNYVIHKSKQTLRILLLFVLFGEFFWKISQKCSRIRVGIYRLKTEQTELTNFFLLNSVCVTGARIFTLLRSF